MQERLSPLFSSLMLAVAGAVLLLASPLRADRFDLRRESIAEEAATTPGLVPWIYEQPGGREELLRPGSLFGAVGVERPLAEGFDPMQNLHGLGGLASQGAHSDRPAYLDLYGRNGTLLITPEQHHNELPTTKLRWGRGKFSGNSLDLQFQRQLLDSLGLGLQVLSVDSKPTESWSYQNATHQPFLSALSRDSSTIPFTGRALSINTWEMIPSLTIKWHPLQLQLHALFSDNSSSEPPPLDPLPNELDPYGPLSWKRDPFTVERSTSSLGGELLLHLPLQTTLTSSIHSTERTTLWEKLTPYLWLNNPFEKLYQTTSSEQQFSEELLGGRTALRSSAIGSHALPLPELRLDWEFRRSQEFPKLPEGAPLSTLDEDRELGVVEWAPRLHNFSMVNQWGWHRISMPSDKQEWDPVASTELEWDSRLVRLKAAGWWRTLYPTLEQRYLFLTGRPHFPNAELLPQESRALSAEGSFFLPHLELYTGVRGERARNWIGATGLEELALSADSVVSDTAAFGWSNWESAESFRWEMGAQLQLGNWNFGLRRYLTPLLQAYGESGWFNIPTLPNRHYAGHIVWQRKVLKKQNLDLSIRWDWHWIGQRLDWRLDPNRNRAIRTVASEWLALNFEARMRILDFELFYRIRNMDHDQYFTAPGYTPAGISFQYGISWLLKG